MYEGQLRLQGHMSILKLYQQNQAQELIRQPDQKEDATPSPSPVFHTMVITGPTPTPLPFVITKWVAAAEQNT